MGIVILNLEGHPNRITGSKVMAILLNDKRQTNKFLDTFTLTYHITVYPWMKQAKQYIKKKNVLYQALFG